MPTPFYAIYRGGKYVVIDMKLNAEGDLDVSELGDISITDSTRQAVLIRLRWIYNEWRFNPEYGFRWFEEVFVKNPNTVKIRGLIRDEIMKVEGVTSAGVTEVTYDQASRVATIKFTFTTAEETYREEVRLNG